MKTKAHAWMAKVSWKTDNAPVVSRRDQRGMALLVAVILLVVMSLVGLAAIRDTILQQRMAINQYDRELAFQSAEAALIVAQRRLSSESPKYFVSHECGPGRPVCPSGHGFDDAVSGKIFEVPISVFNAYPLHQPHYVIDYMGAWPDHSADNGHNHSADSEQYGGHSSAGQSRYYRITARSGDPNSTDGHAVVTLESMVKWG